MKITRIALHPGTGTETVKEIMTRLGVKVSVITDPHHITDQHDGLLLLGGSDINPTYYGERATYAHGINERRDFIEWTLVRRAMTRNIPIMGICRGHQLLAVAHGGSLWQDMTRQGQTYDHPQKHRVTFRSGLEKHAATDLVNSLHHQSVRRIPDGFKIAARSTDGIVEAIWRPGALGVQWHPELLYPTDPRWLALFEWFVNGLE